MGDLIHLDDYKRRKAFRELPAQPATMMGLTLSPITFGRSWVASWLSTTTEPLTREQLDQTFRLIVKRDRDALR